MNRKATADTILLIGTVALTALILLIGVTRFIMPFIKTAPDFTTLDAELTTNAIYAAPDDMTHKFTVVIPRSEGCAQTMLWIKGNMYGETATCPIPLIAASPAFTSSSYGFNIAGYTNDAWTSESKKSQTITFEKTYDNFKRTNKLKIGKW